MVQPGRSLEIVRALSSRSTVRIARELGLFRPTPATEEGAEALRATLERLGTTFVKLGQLLSSRPDIVGELYAERLVSLQDDIEPVAFGDVKAIVEQSLGRPLDEIFSRFDEAPLASASIAQAHTAQRADTGEQVVVKVRRPAIAAVVEQDLQIIEQLTRRVDARFDAARLLQLRAVADELNWSLHRELDMRADAANGRLIHEVLLGHDLIRVPRVHDDLVTEEVMVMERVDGLRIDDALVAARIEPERRRVLARHLLDAFVHQALVEGVYHADPHAGNVLVRPEDGTLVLLDFGLIGKLDDNTRMEFGLVLLAMAENRAGDMASQLLRMSTTDRHSDEQVFEHEIRRLLPRYQRASLAQIDVGQAIIEIQKLALHCRIQLPIPFALIGKTLSQVDTIALALDPEIDPLETIRSSGTKVLLGQVKDLSSPNATVAIWAPRIMSLLDLPGRAERLLDGLERGTVDIGITPNLDEAVSELRTITNRLSSAIVIAAMVIASALLMNVDGVGEIAGYPALGFIGFLASFAFAVLLIWRMLRTEGGV